MSERPTYATRSFTVPAGGSVEIYRQASFLTCLEANGEFEVSFDNAPRVEFEQGLTFRTPGGFDRLQIINPNASALTVRMGFGKGDVRDARLTIGGQLNMAEVMPDLLTTGAAVAAADAAVTLLAAANTARREIVVSNDGVGKIYIGGAAGAAAGEGLPLAAGATLVLETTAAVYARNDSGAAVNVAVAEMERT